MTASRQHRLERFVVSDRGAAAVEFVMVAPMAIAMVLAAINFGFMIYAGATLHFATEDAARCGAVKASCSTPSATQTYAQSRYTGPGVSASFTASLTATCSQVTGSGTYQFNLGIASFSLPLSATACYPRQPTA